MSGRLFVVEEGGMCEERSEHKVEEIFLNSLIGMLLSLRSKMPSLWKKAV